MNIQLNGKARVLITGGAGFIGSHFADLLAKDEAYQITIVDVLTYAAELENLKNIEHRINFQKIDITDPRAIDQLFASGSFDQVIHFAAESHVDNSLINPSIFIDTNVKGTQILLDASIKYKVQKFLHISTDEVYGSISHGSFDETARFNPSSPYSASKAGAEHLVQAARNSFGLNINIVRCSNNFGPRQFPEKLIPLAISRILQNQKIPIFGDGKNSREWLYVGDCCLAIKLVLEKGMRNSVYNISSGIEHTNLFVVREILQLLGQGDELLEYVTDRKGHDFRYSINSTKISKELGWVPTTDFAEGMRETVNWYVKCFKGDQDG